MKPIFSDILTTMLLALNDTAALVSGGGLGGFPQKREVMKAAAQAIRAITEKSIQRDRFRAPAKRQRPMTWCVQILYAHEWVAYRPRYRSQSAARRALAAMQSHPAINRRVRRVRLSVGAA